MSDFSEDEIEVEEAVSDVGSEGIVDVINDDETDGGEDSDLDDAGSKNSIVSWSQNLRHLRSKPATMVRTWELYSHNRSLDLVSEMGGTSM